MSAFFDEKKYPEIDVNERPFMQPLQRFVISQYAQHWEKIGVNLNVTGTTLANIEGNCQHSPNFRQECFRRTLQTWLNIDVDASWIKLRKAINQAVLIAAGMGDQSVMDTNDVKTMGSIGTQQQTFTPPANNGEPSGLPASHKPKRTIDNQEKLTSDGQAPNDARKPEESAAIPRLSPNLPVNEADRRDGRDETDYDGNKIASSGADVEPEMQKYSKIKENLPAYAVIINNQHFNNEKYNRDGADKDVDRLETLDCLNISFEHTLKDLTADEMNGALKFLATKDPNDIKNIEEGKGALKLLGKSEKDAQIFTDLNKIQGALYFGKDGLKEFGDYSCLMVFILTHGADNGKLFGRNLEHTTVEKLSKYFDSKQCKALAGKPKIFFIQACRGKGVMAADGGQGDEKSHVGPTLPEEADFLFFYATPKGYKALRDTTDGSPFIQTLVEGLKKISQHHWHLEEALLSVKYKLAQKEGWIEEKKENSQVVEKKVKMMPSVVSQMRGKIEFDFS